MSKFSIDTTQPSQACYTTQILEVIKEIANRVNYFFFTPICVRSSRFYAFAASYMHSTTIFSRSFLSVFLRAISWQFFSKEQSFLFAFYRMIIVVTLQYSSSLPLSRQVIVVLTNSVIKAFNAALITLFKILFRPTAFLIGIFCIASFIFFIVTVQFIFKGIEQS